jgi:hypothetical protein
VGQVKSPAERLAEELALVPDAVHELLAWLERQRLMRRAGRIEVALETDDAGRLQAVHVPRRYSRARRVG